MFEETDNIVFDFGGVLIDLYRDRCVEAFRRIGYPQAERMLDLYHPADLFNRLESGLVSAGEVCAYIRRDSGLPISDQDIRDAYLAFLGPIPAGKLRAIRALREAGKKTYALSNTNEIVMPYIRETLFTADGLTLEDYFLKAYLSFEMKLLKPDPAIFRAMIADSGMNPEHTLFIDDSPRNVESARKLGFQVYKPEPEEDFTPILYELIGQTPPQRQA